MRLENGTLVTDPSQIAAIYLRSWFILDVTSSFPIDIIFLIIGKDNNNKNLKFIRVIRLLRYTKALRVMKLYAKNSSMAHSTLNPGAVQLGRLTVTVLAAWHFVGCLYWIISKVEGWCDPPPSALTYDDDALSSFVAGFEYCLDRWAPYVGFIGRPLKQQYTQAVWWAVQVSTGIGRDIIPRTNGEVAFMRHLLAEFPAFTQAVKATHRGRVASCHRILQSVAYSDEQAGFNFQRERAATDASVSFAHSFAEKGDKLVAACLIQRWVRGLKAGGSQSPFQNVVRHAIRARKELLYGGKPWDQGSPPHHRRSSAPEVQMAHRRSSAPHISLPREKPPSPREKPSSPREKLSSPRHRKSGERRSFDGEKPPSPTRRTSKTAGAERRSFDRDRPFDRRSFDRDRRSPTHRDGPRKRPSFGGDRNSRGSRDEAPPPARRRSSKKAPPPPRPSGNESDYASDHADPLSRFRLPSKIQDAVFEATLPSHPKKRPSRVDEVKEAPPEALDDDGDDDDATEPPSEPEPPSPAPKPPSPKPPKAAAKPPSPKPPSPKPPPPDAPKPPKVLITTPVGKSVKTPGAPTPRADAAAPPAAPSTNPWGESSPDAAKQPRRPPGAAERSLSLDSNHSFNIYELEIMEDEGDHVV